MSLHKLYFVTLLATMVAFAAAANQSSRSHRADAVRAKSETASAALVPVQSKNAKDLGAGKLLVASREMGDPSFAKTVILLVHYDDQAVVGLVLNRRTDIALSRVLDNFQGAKDRSDLAYLGGPVDVSTVFALLQPPAKVEGAEHIFSDIYLISTKSVFEKALASRPDPKAFHVYLGYAGWTSDQLRTEVQLGAWFIFPGEAGAVFNSDPDLLWQEMIGKTELKYAQAAPPSTDPRVSLLESATERNPNGPNGLPNGPNGLRDMIPIPHPLKPHMRQLRSPSAPPMVARIWSEAQLMAQDASAPYR